MILLNSLKIIQIYNSNIIESKIKSLRSDSNRRPTDYESVALPTAPLRHTSVNISQTGTFLNIKVKERVLMNEIKT